MGRRILAFFLGFIFAFVVIAGAFAIVIFAVKVDQFAPDSDKFLGDLSHMSIYDLGKSIADLYTKKAGVADETTGKYYTLQEFCANYNIDLNTALGMELPQEVLDIPAFEMFKEGGIERAMKQIKVSAVPAIMRMFGGEGGMFTDSAVSELSKFSLYDLLSDENVGIAGVFANISFAEILPDSFPAQDSDNKLMWAVGQTKVGGLLDGIGGSDSILLQLKTGGAFETLGGLELSVLLGESQYVDAIMGSNAVFADLIGDDGTIRFDEIINGVSVGELLGCQKNEIADLEGYAEVDGTESTVKSKVTEDETVVYVMSGNGENWYEAEIKCEDETEGHVHGSNCYKYVWYSTTECNKEHNHSANGDMLKEGIYYARTDGLYAVLAALSITDLTSGNTDALMDEIKKIKIGDIIDAANIDGIMEAFIDLTIEELMNGAIDDMYLGEFFSLHRDAIQNLNDYDIENAITINNDNDHTLVAYYVAFDGNNNIAMSNNLKDWYVGVLDCSENHEHGEDCYGYKWYDELDAAAIGIQNKLASKRIADLKNLNDEVQKLTLTDVFGKDNVPPMLSSIADVKIGNLSEAVNTIHLGQLLEYEQTLNCENTDEGHEHDENCYVWIKDGEQATGLIARLAGKQVKDLNSIETMIMDFTLLDVLGEDGMPDILKALADTKIGELNEAIKAIRLCDLLEYEQRYLCGHETEDEHDENCEYAWYKLSCSNTDEGHEHDENCYVKVNGMMSELAGKTVEDLTNMDEIVQDFTLRDVFGEELPKILQDVADVKIKDINGAIQDIYLGTALGYVRKQVPTPDFDKYGVLSGKDEKPIIRGSLSEGVYFASEDGIVWYEAYSSTINGEKKYGYVWYETDENGDITENEVSGVVKAFVNNRVGNIDSSMETVTLGELGICGENNILIALKDTPINGIADGINDLQMAVVLGYTKNYTCGQSISTSHPSHADCPYEWVDGDKQPVKGLNAIVADKKVGEMDGEMLTNIAMDLTVGDLIDTGMISLGDTTVDQENNYYKLSIIFDREGENHYFSMNDTRFHCNILEYATYTATLGKGTTTRQYWENCHNVAAGGKLTDEQVEHRDYWKTLTLKNFVNELINAIG